MSSDIDTGSEFMLNASHMSARMIEARPPLAGLNIAAAGRRFGFAVEDFSDGIDNTLQTLRAQFHLTPRRNDEYDHE